jgi:DNA-binding winged helix-turn-helix (wHTH) protein
MFNPNLTQYSQNINSKFVVGSLVYDSMNQRLSTEEHSIYLRQKLNEVFYYMVANQSRLVSREELIEKVWNGNFYTGVKAVTHTVCKLRKTLEDLGVKDVNIRTLPKQGYTLHTC